MRMGSFEAYAESLRGNRDVAELYLATYDLEGASHELRDRLLAELKRHMKSLEGSRLSRRMMAGSPDFSREIVAFLKSECDRTFPHIIACACEPEALAITLSRRTAARGSYAEAR